MQTPAKSRSKKKKRRSQQQTEIASEHHAQMVSQLQQLGLPTGFGTSKVCPGQSVLHQLYRNLVSKFLVNVSANLVYVLALSLAGVTKPGKL